MKKLLLAALALGFFVNPSLAQARVETEPKPIVVCSPISSLTAKGDGRVGELGTASVQVDYSVKPCDKTQTVRVMAQIIDWATGTVLYEDPNALMSGRILLYVPARHLYTGKVTVFDAATGEVLGTKSYTVSTTPKGV